MSDKEEALEYIIQRMDKLDDRIISDYDIRITNLEHQYVDIAIIKDRENRMINDIDKVREDIDKERIDVAGTTRRLHTRIDDVENTKLKILEEHIKSLEKVVNEAQTRNKTLMSVLGVSWFVISGIAGTMITSAKDQVTEYVNLQEKMNFSLNDLKRAYEGNEENIKAIPKLTRRIENLESERDKR